ncbi:MAG: DUF6765 family protein [Candidatus Cloacimonadales bacterium]
MNIEFHYYMTKYLALEAGFDAEESEIIAYSSQLVDDNNISFEIATPHGETYKNFITQTPNILEPELKLMRKYLLFHYLPGVPTGYKTKRKDGKMHMLITTPVSTHANEIFYESTRSADLHILGIATHMLADSISHQNFVGTYDEINSMNGVWETLIPQVGHAAAGHKPDIPNLIWHDSRLIEDNATIDNRERVLLAAKRIYSNFLIITSLEKKWSKIKANLNPIIDDSIDETQLELYPEQKAERIKKIRELLAEFEADSEYEKNKWLNEAIKEDTKFLENEDFCYDSSKDQLSFQTDFEKSNWFKFQENVKTYQRIAIDKLSPILDELELREW